MARMPVAVISVVKSDEPKRARGRTCPACGSADVTYESNSLVTPAHRCPAGCGTWIAHKVKRLPRTYRCGKRRYGWEAAAHRATN